MIVMNKRNDGDYSHLFASRNDMMRDYRGVHAKNVTHKHPSIT